MVSDSKNTLAGRFEELKYHFHLNNSELSQIAEVTPSAIHDIIHGKTENPKIGIFINITQKLGVNLSWLAKGEGEMLSAGASTAKNSVNSYGESTMIEFLKSQIAEKDKVINRLLDRLGKRRGVSNQAVLFAEA